MNFLWRGTVDDSARKKTGKRLVSMRIKKVYCSRVSENNAGWSRNRGSYVNRNLHLQR